MLAMHKTNAPHKVFLKMNSGMAQEARLLLDGQALPDVLKRGANAIDDRLPRRAVRLRRGAGDGDGRGQARQPLRAGKSGLARHDAFRGMTIGLPPYQSEAPTRFGWSLWLPFRQQKPEARNLKP